MKAEPETAAIMLGANAVPLIDALVRAELEIEHQDSEVDAPWSADAA